MGDVIQETASGVGDAQGRVVNQDISQASVSGVVDADQVIVDGYCVCSSKPTVFLWPAFKSNSWRIRLKRVHDSLSKSSAKEKDEPTTSSISDQKRYSYAYSCRLRCTSPEVLPKIDSQNLLEIAGSTAQAFKDVCVAIKKREEARNSSKKVRKSLATTTEPISEKQGTGKKRSKEVEETPKSKEKSRHKDRDSQIETKEKTRRKSKDAPEPQKKKSRKDKKERSSSQERKDVNGSKFNLTTLSGGTPSPSEEGLSALPEKEETAEKMRKDTPPSILQTEQSSSVDIKGWSKEKIIEFFDLKEFTIDISDFPHHELQPSTSSQGSGENFEEATKYEEKLPDTVKSNTAESDPAPDKDKNKENVELKEEENSKRKRKRSASMSSSCSSASSSRHPSSDESDNDRNTQAKSAAKKKPHSERPCVECGRWLDDCVKDWRETLGQSSVWCSRECIERRVARAHEVLPEGYGALTLLRGDGQLLTTGPTLVNLAEFIYKYPEYEPVLPVAKKKSPAKNEQTRDTKKSNPKLLSKDSDRIRFNVRRAFSDALVKRAKMDKVKSAMKLCKDIAENVEAALFKNCESNLNSPKYKSWTKAFIENVADCRNKSFYYRVLMGMISVHKVVTLEADDMKKPEYSAPLDDEGKNVATASAKVEDVTPLSSLTNDPKVEESGQDVKEIPAKIDNDSVTSASLSEPNLSRKTPTKKEQSVKLVSSSQKKSDVRPMKRPMRRSDSQKSAQVSALDAILGDGAKDTTEQHLSHFYDVNCSICLAKQKSQAETERKEREEKEKQREEDRRFREMLPPERRYGSSLREQRAIDDLNTSERLSYDEFKRVQTPESTGAACASDDEYAGSYGAGDNESPIFGDTSIPLLEPRRTMEEWRECREPGFVEPIWSGPSTTVWNGKISINNSMVMTSLCLVSNPIAYRTAPELPHVLRIKGRIGPVIVFDYVHGIVKNREHHVCVLRLTTPVDYEDEQRFFSLYEDMIRKGRYFAIDVPADSCFKDMYLMPLPPGEEPPAILLPFDGPGIPSRHPPMIICVMVVYGSGRPWCPDFQNSLLRDVVPGRSPKDPPVSVDSVPSRPRSSTPGSPDERIRPVSTVSQEVQVSPDRIDEEVPKSAEKVHEPENIPHDTVFTSAADANAPQSELQSQSVVTTPSDSPQMDFAPVCEADSLLPSKFFVMCKEAAKEPVKVPDAEEIDSLPDLLVYIQLNNNPREIKEVVARFMMNPTLSDEDRELIRKKVMEKISSEKKKKAENKKPRDPSQDSTLPEEEHKQDNVSKPKSDESQESLDIDSIDIDSLNQLSSFVGEGAKDLLMQVGDEPEPTTGQSPSPPPPPPPAPPPAPPFEELQGQQKLTKSSQKMNENRENALSCSEMLPGPPPVPPVYGDNDSSESETPPDHKNKSVVESPNLPLPPPFPHLGVVPLPPPPPTVSSRTDIAVPPPPPPPPCVSDDKNGSTDRPSTSTAQAFIAPPPPPPVLAAPQSAPAAVSSQLGPQMPFPPPPGVFPPIPMPPIPNMMPGFHPPFMGRPPPVVPGIAPGMPGTPRHPYPVQSGMGPPPPSTMRAPGFIPQPQGPGFPRDNREFFAGPSPNRPGFVHGPPPGFLPTPQAPGMDIPQNQPSAIAGTLPTNHGAAGFHGGSHMSQERNTFSELAPLPSQIATAQITPKRVPPSGIVPSLGRALTEKDLIPRTPTPLSPSSKSVPIGRNGPRTPSPDFLKKRSHEETLARLKEDIAAHRKEVELRMRDEPDGRKLQNEMVNDSSLSWQQEAGNKNAVSAHEPTSSRGNTSDSDAMEVDAGESEGENDHDEGLRGGNTRQFSGRGTAGPGERGRRYEAPQGRRGLPPTPRSRGPFGATPRGRPPQQARRGGFMTPQPSAPPQFNRGRFFSPQMRDFRGAPNLRRGLTFDNRGGGSPAFMRGGFPPRMPPSFGRGEFYGSHGMHRGGPPPRGMPQNRPRDMF